MMYNQQKTGARLLAASLIFALTLPAVLVPISAHAVGATATIEVPGPSLFKQIITAAATVATKVSSGATAASTGISAGKDTKDTIEDYIIKPLALALGRAAIQSITTSTVNWINGGFQGSPAFATDLSKNLRQLGDGVAQQFLLELTTNAKIDSPYIDTLTNVGAAYYLYSGRGALAARLQDTLGQSSRDAAAFRAGNFNEGGWGAFMSQVTNDANNPIGARMIASQALAERLSSAAERRVQELAWGSGFLSWKGDCIEADISMAQQAALGLDATQAAMPPANLSDAEGCTNHETITPGSFIENKLNVASDSPLRQLELAQSIDQIVGALAQQLISKALGGSGGLRGVSNPTSGGGASATSQGGTSATGGLVSPQTGLATSIQTSINQVSTWKTDSQSILTAAQLAQGACANNPTALANPVGTAISASNSAIARAADLITSLSQMLAQLQASPEGPNSPSGNTYLEVSSNYQALSLPSSSEMSQTSTDAKPTGNSLTVQLNTLSTNGCVVVVDDFTVPVDPRL